MKAIEVTNLTKKYGDFTAVNNISFSINYGEIFGFIGQNGAGKSTTIKSILNFIFQTSGKISVDGFDSIKNAKEIKAITSYVPSEVSFYSNMRVNDIIKYTNELNHNLNNTLAIELCDYLELDYNKKIDELSLGNKKKVSIIQALIKKPKVLILDEPTSGLDPIIQERLFKLLSDEKNKGCAIFLSSHNLYEVEKYCDRVGIIREGVLLDICSLDKFKKTNRKYNVTYETNTHEIKSIIWDKPANELLDFLKTENPISFEVNKVSIEEEFKKYYEEC